jgi:hypothetical protein
MIERRDEGERKGGCDEGRRQYMHDHTRIWMNLDSAPLRTDSVSSMNSVGSGEMESWSSAGREEGNEALSSTNTYDGMPESASTGGVMQVRVLLSMIVQ